MPTCVRKKNTADTNGINPEVKAVMDELILEVVNITSGASVVSPLAVDASPNDSTIPSSECEGSVSTLP